MPLCSAQLAKTQQLKSCLALVKLQWLVLVALFANGVHTLIFKLINACIYHYLLFAVNPYGPINIHSELGDIHQVVGAMKARCDQLKVSGNGAVNVLKSAMVNLLIISNQIDKEPNKLKLIVY